MNDWITSERLDQIIREDATLIGCNSTSNHEVGRMAREIRERRQMVGVARLERSPTGDNSMKCDSNGFPRRNRIDLYTPAELAIREAMLAIQRAGAHPLLTDAVVLLGEAKDKVADFVELRKRPLVDFCWVPEAPGHPGLYANVAERKDGKTTTGYKVSTYDIHSARQFASKEDCQAWCDANPVPVFVPVEHGFYGGVS